jgi:hypothetical protein
VERTVTLRDQLTVGLVAGLAGGILIEAFLFATQLARGLPGGARAADFAVAALGPGALGGPASVFIGAAIQLCIAIAWALGYVSLLRSQPQLIARPWLSGACFGLIVYFFVQIVLLTAGVYHTPQQTQLVVDVVAYVGCYGIAVALVASRLLRRPSTGSGQA